MFVQDTLYTFGCTKYMYMYMFTVYIVECTLYSTNYTQVHFVQNHACFTYTLACTVRLLDQCT